MFQSANRFSIKDDLGTEHVKKTRLSCSQDRNQQMEEKIFSFWYRLSSSLRRNIQIRCFISPVNVRVEKIMVPKSLQRYLTNLLHLLRMLHPISMK